MSNEKPPKHWAEKVLDRLIALFCFAAIGAIVVTHHVMQIWITPPPNWLYWGLAGVAFGITTDDAKGIMITFLKTWAGKTGK